MGAFNLIEESVIKPHRKYYAKLCRRSTLYNLKRNDGYACEVSRV